MDDMATLRIGAGCDEVMRGVMIELGISVPETQDLDEVLAGRTRRGYAEYGLD
jgi:hypothetical protein